MTAGVPVPPRDPGEDRAGDDAALVTEEMVERAFLARLEAEETAFCGPDAMRAALAAVAPDIAAAERARCAAELRAALARSPATPRVAVERAMKRWEAR